MGSNRGTVLALSVALGAALLVIAFLLGRQSAGTPNREGVGAELTPAPPLKPDPERKAEVETERRWPKWADLTDWDDSADRALDSSKATVERIETTHKDTFALTNRGSRAPPQTEKKAPSSSGSDQRAASVTDYFRQVDQIHSEEGAGDPNAFAMDLIKGGLGGATSGFDQLIADTQQMEQEMQSLAPPPSCESYHKASIEALVESRQMLENMRDAIVGRDIEKLNAIALQSKSLQRKAQAIEEMRELIVASSNAY